MKKHVVALTIAAVGSIGITAGSITPAAADTPRCVTRNEFDKVHRGVTKARVHRIFDTNGWFADGAAGGFTRGYQTCRDGHAAYVTYRGFPKPHRTVEKRWRAARS